MASETFVSPTGSISGNGSVTNPWDLASALANASGQIVAGDTVYLRGGVYQGKFTSSLTGTQANPITVRSYPGEWAKIDGYVTTTLNGSLTTSGTTIILTDGSKFVEGSVIVVHGDGTEANEEHIALGTKSGNTFTGSSRGWNGTTARNHASGLTVILGGNNFTVNGSDTIYRDFEIMNSDPVRSWGSGVNGQSAPHLRGEGVWHAGPRTKLINLVIHDVQDGIFSPVGAVDVETYGCIIYNNGYVDANGPAGHGWYIQNNQGSTKKYIDNFTFNNQFFGAQEESVSGNTVNINNTGLVVFGNPFLVGAQEGVVDNVNFTNGFVYVRNLPGLRWGYLGSNGSTSVTDNYLAGDGNALLDMKNWSTATVRRNTFVIRGSFANAVILKRSLGTYAWNDNTYHDKTSLISCMGGDACAVFGLDNVEGACGGNLKFSEWKTASGFDAASTYTETIPPNAVFVRPNGYEPGRANIIIYNWSLSSSVSVNLSTAGLINGQSYEIRSVQNYFGTPVSGTYNVASPIVSVSMSGTVAQPVGGLTTRTTTFPEFGAFVVIPTSTPTPPPVPPPIPPPPEPPPIPPGPAIGSLKKDVPWDVSDKQENAEAKRQRAEGWYWFENQLGKKATFVYTGVKLNT